MKNIVATFLLLINFIYINAQSTHFEWINPLGGTGYDGGNSVATDANGNVYVTGRFENTVDFDPGTGVLNLTAAGSSDIFVSKTAPSGNVMWVKQMGGSAFDIANGIALDSINNIYITGNFIGTGDFDPNSGVVNLISNSASDIFVLKLDSLGNLKWAKNFESNDLIYGSSGHGIAVDKAGAVYTTGYFGEGVDFDPSGNVFSMYALCHMDIFISKLDAQGNFIWAKQMGGLIGNSDNGFSIALDKHANVYSTGSFLGTADFDPGAGTYTLTSYSNNFPNIYISKLDSSGNFVWAKQIESNGYGIGLSITTDNFNSVYSTGTFRGPSDFDPSVGITTLNGGVSSACYILKLNSTGNFIWAKQLSGNYNNSDIEGRSIKTDILGYIYTAGSFSDSADFDPGINTAYLVSNGFTDAFISKLSPSGNFEWVKQIGSTSFEQAYAVTIDQAGNVYTTGSFEDIAYYENNSGTSSITSQGSADIFLHKMSQELLNSIQNYTRNGDYSIHPNPTNGIINISSLNKENYNSVIEIYNSIGELIYSAKNNNSIQSIDMSQQKSGIYFLKITDNKGIVKTQSIIKE